MDSSIISEEAVSKLNSNIGVEFLDSVSCTTDDDDKDISNGSKLSPPSSAMETLSASSSNLTKGSEMLSPSQSPSGSTKAPLRRRLVFDLVCDSEKELEFTLMESINKSFLELIVSNQAKELSNGYSTMEDDSSDGSKTPSPSPPLTGTVDICPAVPVRPVTKARRLDQGICRKLEFESSLI